MNESQNTYVEGKKLNKKSTYCLMLFIQNSRKYKLIYSDN